MRVLGVGRPFVGRFCNAEGGHPDTPVNGRTCPAGVAPGRGHPSDRRAVIPAVQQFGACQLIFEFRTGDGEHVVAERIALAGPNESGIYDDELGVELRLAVAVTMQAVAQGSGEELLRELGAAPTVSGRRAGAGVERINRCRRERESG